MPTPSAWPLSETAIRFFVPLPVKESLSEHPLSRPLYLHGAGYYPKAQGHHMTRTEHEDNLVLYCVSGNGQLETRHGQTEIATGDLIVLPKGLAHHYHANPLTPWTLYWAHYDGLSTHVFHQHLRKDETPVLRPGLHPGLIQAFQTLLAARHHGFALPDLIHASQGLAQIFTHTAVLLQEAHARHESHAGLARAQAWMDQHLDAHISLDALAREAGVSKWHFVSAYRKAYGNPPIQHFIQKKMNRACELLDSNTLGVAEIAFRLGYEDVPYFSRLFKKVMGLSPQAYQRTTRV